jgi:hypothetical protein
VFRWWPCTGNMKICVAYGDLFYRFFCRCVDVWAGRVGTSSKTAISTHNFAITRELLIFIFFVVITY